MKPSIYGQRRQALANRYHRTLFVIPSGDKTKRSHSVKFRFKPAAYFTYLCGLHLAGAILVICGENTILLCEQHSDQLWGEDTVLTSEDSPLLAGIQIEPIEKLEEIIRAHKSGVDRLAMSLGRDTNAELVILSVISYDRKLRDTLTAPVSVCDSRMLVGSIRLEKDEDEIENMLEAGLRSSAVHRRLMQESLVGKTEREVANWIEANFLLENMQWTSYETVVGSGRRSTILHARATDRVMESEEILLVDAGGEWNGYCADITRVIPADKKFSPKQREVYCAVLNAQKLALKSVKPGLPFQEIHEIAKEALIEDLARLTNREALIRKSIGTLFPHSTSHWLGMDVHDPSPYLDDEGNPIRLKAGMCFTVEPGLYFSDEKIIGRYNGIGVRIEDDVVVTADGCKQLSDVPKELEEIEELRSRSGSGSFEKSTMRQM